MRSTLLKGRNRGHHLPVKLVAVKLENQRFFVNNVFYKTI